MDTIIELYEAAHNRWQSDWSREDFRDSLQGLESTAVHFADMDRQVANGGWSQWYHNSYYTPEVLSFLKLRARQDLEQTSAVVEMQRILDEVGLICESADATMSHWDYDVDAKLDLLDAAYHGIDGAVLRAVEAWLVAKRP